MDSPRTCRVILSGASGLIGRAVLRALHDRGTETLQLVRRKPSQSGEIQWDSSSDPAIADPAKIEGAAAAIHLSGANVAAHRWTESYRREMFVSRVDSTRRLATLLAGLRNPPQTLLVASAVGIYGDRGDEILDESSAPGRGFLASLCQDWESAAKPAQLAGIRVVHLRLGVVLAPGEGALKRMLPAFKVGLGARIGNGRQWMSWIGLSDALTAVQFALENEEIAGPLNVTAPNPVTNAEFTSALGAVLYRPAFLAVPAFMMRSMFGQMAEEALLASARVFPRKLQNAGFQFELPTVDRALSAALNR